MREQSLPTVTGFNPDIIPWHREVIDLVRHDFDYSKGNLEILLSGSVGSAKTLLVAHLITTHCLLYPGARAAVCRRALPDVKKTIWEEIINHLEPDYKEGRDWWQNRAEMVIYFRNGSKIQAVSWADRRYKRFRSMKFSAIAFEEMVENDEEDRQAFIEAKARLRRVPGVTENFFIGATNAGEPSHWIHKYFMDEPREKPRPTRRVFYSLTEANPFLDPVYVQQLKADYTKKEVMRYLEGQWIELNTEAIYYAYKSETNYRARQVYTIDKNHPIWISHDFNIAAGKPMSAILFQYIDDTFHFFAEAVIEGARTAELIEDIDGRGLLFKGIPYMVCGDAAGKNKDTRSSRSDYDIIMRELQTRDINATFKVLPSNPPIRTRHNEVNRYCENGLGLSRLFLYHGCKVADEGMRLTKLKPGASYIEDDSKAYQHVTTAIGYGVSTVLRLSKAQSGGTIIL